MKIRWESVLGDVECSWVKAFSDSPIMSSAILKVCGSFSLWIACSATSSSLSSYEEGPVKIGTSSKGLLSSVVNFEMSMEVETDFSAMS